MIKRLLVVFSIVFSFVSKTIAQCPQIYDYLGNASNNAQFIYCQTGPYNMNIQSPSNFPAYTINWGDGTPNSTGASYLQNTLIPHTYAATVNTFVITLTIPASACTKTMLVVMELPVTSAICIPSLGLTQACAPKTLTFTNCSGSVSGVTTFTWDFGDGSPQQVFNSSNAGQNVLHTYQKGTVNCQTAVTLTSHNFCRFTSSSVISYNPIQIYDIDVAAISTPLLTRCWPDNSFTFTNNTAKNCIPEGNTAQRYEYWNLGNHFGKGVDSIVNWRPWPPSAVRTVTYPAVGSYTVFLADSNQCGIDLTTLTVNIVNPPVAGVIAPLGLICQGASVTFTNTSAPGYSYKWNFGTNPAFVNIGGGNKSNVYSTPGTYTVKVVAYVNGSNNFCSDTAKVVINVLAAPVSNFAFSPAVGCGTITGVTFTNSSTGASTYTWTFGNGNSSTLLTPPAQNYTLAGAYTVSLAITATTGCVNTKTGGIIVYAKPVPNFPSFANCVNAVSNFTNTSAVTGTAAINSYTWNFGDGTAMTNSLNPSHTYTVANTYTVKLIAATAFCVDSITNTISINLRPVANFVFTPTISCPPFAITFSNTTANGVNYLWRFNALPTATSNLAAPSFTYLNNTQTVQNSSITLIAYTGAGCADSIRKVIAVYPKPVASFTTSSIAGCSPISVNFTNTSIGVNTYSWNFGDGAATTQTNTSHTYTNIGLVAQLTTVELFVTNSFSCRDTIRHTLQVFPQPLSTFTLTPGSGCGPLAVAFSPALGAISYTWDYGDGSPISNATNPPHTFTNTGTTDLSYTVNLGTTNAFGCTGSTSGVALVYGKPVANFIYSPNAGCTPMAVTFTNTSLLNTVNAWQFGNGLVSAGADPATTYTNGLGEASKVFTVKLVITSSNGCKDSINKQVTILGQPKSAFTLDTPACAPKLIHFQNNSLSANSYTWNFGDGTQSIQQNPQKLFTNTGLVNAVFNVSLSVTSNDGCIDLISVPVIIHPKPTFFVISSPDSGCSPLKVVFSKVAGAVKYTWDYYQDGSPTVVSTNSVSNVYQNTTDFDKTFQAQMIAEDANGCKDTAYKTIKVFPNPTARFRADPAKVYVPNEAMHFIDLSVLASTYQWNFGDGSTSQEKLPVHYYTQPGEYQITLTVTSTRGCKDSYQLPDKVEGLNETAVAMPNAFTPNPNGSPGGFYDPLATNNDVFHPQIRGTEKYELSIYSRWGELLFDTKNPAEGWDGYYKGKLCTQDVYIWKVNATFVDGKTYNKTGDLLLLR